ncbi:MAG: hypothetical protein IKJ58_04795 [Akkermansia sp.]|nr:hypothetical protein [Akkermansia sp.]
MKAVLRYTLLVPLIFYLCASSGIHLLEHLAAERAWASAAAPWLGDSPERMVFHPNGYDHELQEWRPVYFSFPASEEWIQTALSNLQLTPAELPRKHYAEINKAISREGGTTAVRHVYNRSEKLIVQSDLPEYTLDCTPWLIQLRDGRCLYLAEYGTLEPARSPSPATYPDKIYLGAPEWQRYAETALLHVLLIIPALLCGIPYLLSLKKMNRISNPSTAYICLLLPLLTCLLWYIISPTPNEDGIYLTIPALILNAPIALMLSLLALTKKNNDYH